MAIVTSSTRLLSIDEVEDTLTKAGFSRSNWFSLGRKLKLSDDVLTAIEADHRHDTQRCFHECLVQWLKGPSTYRTWDTMATALRDTGETAAAEAVEARGAIEKYSEPQSEASIPSTQHSTKIADYKPPFAKVPCADDCIATGNIAAIDFGTTSVSLAYTTRGDDLVNTMKLNHSDQSTRVPNTAILFKREGSEVTVAAIGNVAMRRLQTIKPDNLSKYICFAKMKESLRKDRDIDRQSLVESFSGEQFYLVEVIAFILKYLKDRLIDHLSGTVNPLKTTDFDWVITVPAIWDARGKRMMREAAYLAGLLKESGGIVWFTSVSGHPFPPPIETNPDKLSLALEPEAAAYYCREQSDRDVGHSSCYMVIDIGGGTVDITAHKETGDGSLEVITVPTGDTCGGERVNEAFSTLLQKVVNDDPDFKKFFATSPKSQIQRILNELIHNEFEGQKILFGNCKIDEIAIAFHTQFIRFYYEALEAGAKEIPGIEYEDDILFIAKYVVESKLFGPTLDGIIRCVLQAIQDTEFQVDTFYLVGAFGGCKYVSQKVKAAIEKKYQSKRRHCHVLVPVQPFLAVAQGAVMLRRNPEKVKTRRADATYGIGVTLPFDSEKHDERYKSCDEENSSQDS